MSATVSYWVVIVVLGLGTFLLRSVPIWLHGRSLMPGWIDRFLRYVPAAALTALVVPGSLYVKHAGAYEFAPARVVAAVVALLIAVRTKNIIATLTGGMVVLWVGQALLG